MDIKKITPQNIMLILILITLVILAAFIIKPFITTILAALIIGYICYPLYKAVNKRIKNNTASSILICIFIILLIITPSFLIIHALTKEAAVFYIKAKDIIEKYESDGNHCNNNTNPACTLINAASNLLKNQNLKNYLKDGLEKITSALIRWATGFALAIPLKILEGLMIIIIIFHFLKDYDKFIEKLKMFIPIKIEHRKHITKQIHNVIHAVIFGYIIVAIIEAVIGMIGFRLFVPDSSYILWGIVIGFTALIPLIGAGIVWMPAIIIQLFNHHYLLAAGIVLCWTATSYIDTITRAKIIGDNAKIHPLLVLIGAIGGIALIGTIGLVIGPLTLALLDTLLKILMNKGAENR
jgi:predicted PurR-regulated permease PerM